MMIKREIFFIGDEKKMKVRFLGIGKTGIFFSVTKIINLANAYSIC